ncbi:phosphotransferase family protein [Aspergillus sclerotioniger CBS 115572]|uniref:Phosphotransferase family protein n=1 Tax=Aspergillus sclerotioniger CBS 115572 TaxID=1450535 RepID=A0A317WI01_9EURO|nr:phosphotransferase family protein [Aspergillus sclerotioniger CBS 115572]PWY83830.1 phosphotransferase family protein [Aspergillus sclerotioniger CBS 115572]
MDDKRSRVSDYTVSEKTPATPRIPGKTVRRAWGFLHRALFYLSQHYCSWFNIPFNAQIVQLPFGLVMKWTDRTSIEEAAAAMQMAAAAGIPVPKFLSCGEHPADPFNRRISILMTRIPGVPLENSFDPLQVETEEPWLNELRTCVHSMRRWCLPNPTAICSPLGTCLRSPRIPSHIMGPFANTDDFYEYLLTPASSHGFESIVEYNQVLSCARRIQDRPHRIMFTHGDFKAHNIVVDDDGHLSGFSDWESAGWYPEYWEFTTAMRFGRGSWWFQVAEWMGGDQYADELASDIALNELTVDSYIAM